jgi:hypothetical protein
MRRWVSSSDNTGSSVSGGGVAVTRALGRRGEGEGDGEYDGEYDADGDGECDGEEVPRKTEGDEALAPDERDNARNWALMVVE